MNRFLQWFWNPAPVAEDRKSMDQAMHDAFASPSGRRVLDYLIAEHYAIVTAPTMLDQCAYNEGRRLVVQDILDAINRAMTNLEETKIETTEVRNG